MLVIKENERRPFWKRNRNGSGHPPGTKIHVDLDRKTVTCPKCKTVHSGSDVWQRLYICPKCGKYMPISAKERLAMVLDETTFEPWFEEIGICDPLQTPGYPEKLAAALEEKLTGDKDVFLSDYFFDVVVNYCVTGLLEGIGIKPYVMSGASMGEVADLLLSSCAYHYMKNLLVRMGAAPDQLASDILKSVRMPLF